MTLERGGNPTKDAQISLKVAGDSSATFLIPSPPVTNVESSRRQFYWAAIAPAIPASAGNVANGEPHQPLCKQWGILEKAEDGILCDGHKRKRGDPTGPLFFRGSMLR